MIRSSTHVLILTGIAAVCFCVVMAFSFTTEMRQSGDDSGYLTLGMSLAQGHGFRNLSDPSMPHFLWWPPGFPVVVAGWYLVGGPAWVALKIAVMVLLFASLWLFARMVGRANGSLLDAAMLLVAMGLSSAVHLVSSYLYSETFYLALTLLFFVAWQRWKDRLTVGRIALLAVWALYVASVRNIGVALPLALAGMLALHCRRDARPQIRWSWIVPVVLLAVYSWAVLTIPAVQVGSFQSFFGVHASSTPVAVPSAPAPGAMTKIAHAIRGYGVTLIPQAVVQTAYDAWQMDRLKAACMGLVSLVVSVGWVVSLRRFGLVGLYAALYMAVLFAYGPLYVRLMSPIAPLLLLYLYLGVKTVLWRLVRRPRIATIMLCALWCAVIADNAWWTVAHPRKYMPPRFGDEQYQQCIAWVKSNAHPGDVVVSRVDMYLFLQRGPYNVPFYLAPTPEALINDLDRKGARYLMVSPFGTGPGPSHADVARAAQRAFPTRFARVFGAETDSSYVLEYRQ